MKEHELVIAGGAGFVGRNLVRVLDSKNYDLSKITVIDKDEENLKTVKKYNVRSVCANLAEEGEWEKELEGKETVVNLTAQISSPEYDPFYENNVLTVKKLLQASEEKNVDKIIHFSSAGVLSKRKDWYSQTKEEAEELVKDSGIKYCILRPSIIYGPTDDKNIGYLIDFAKKFPFFPIPGHGKWPRQPIYVDDICNLVISIFEDFPENKIYDINGKNIVYFKDMVETVIDQLDSLTFTIHLPVRLFKALMMAYQRVKGEIKFTPDQVDSLTAGEVFPEYPWWEEFDIKVTPFEKGVRKMIKT